MTVPGPEHWLVDGVDEGGAVVTWWDGGGRVANEQGDLYSTAPHRIVPWGRMSIEVDRLEGALAAGWKFDPGADEGFARIYRAKEDRPAG